jgi:hypothetical protein
MFADKNRQGTGQIPCSICHANEIAINAMKAA